MDQEQTDRESIGSRGLSFGASLEPEAFDIVTSSFYFGTVFVKDEDGFEQGVIDSSGRASVAGSSLNVNIFAASVGVRSPNLALTRLQTGNYAVLWAFARGGYSGQWASRSIENCVDCSSEDIELGNGPLAEAGVAVGLPSANNGLGFYTQILYRKYLVDSAASDVLNFGLGFSLL